MTTVHTGSCPFGGWAVGDPAAVGARDKLYIFIGGRLAERASPAPDGRLVMSGTVTFLAFRSRSVLNSCFKTGCSALEAGAAAANERAPH
ncbi:unnamed protein product [Arctia plantaginis]|uniref:Uncharacterized protein n=1 Tax=Arctia plantaginis TaxID=874455 RepID=A0A8S1A4M5_ARCPL|nr:unnamed protein product [Arctia plantaginis]CAB3239344.1 unnamed protein product [Arctia plantaginis]